MNLLLNRKKQKGKRRKIYYSMSHKIKEEETNDIKDVVVLLQGKSYKP